MEFQIEFYFIIPIFIIMISQSQTSDDDEWALIWIEIWFTHHKINLSLSSIVNGMLFITAQKKVFPLRTSRIWLLSSQSLKQKSRSFTRRRVKSGQFMQWNILIMSPKLMKMCWNLILASNLARWNSANFKLDFTSKREHKNFNKI